MKQAASNFLRNNPYLCLAIVVIGTVSYGVARLLDLLQTLKG